MAQHYTYTPVYGVERFKNVTNAPVTNITPVSPGAETFGGGAELTNNNLLVSLWSNLQVDENLLPVAGDLLQPIYAQDGAAVSFLPTHRLYAPMFDSRTAFKISFHQEEQDAEPMGQLLGFMNPPAELKNFYQNAARAVLDGASPIGFDFESLKNGVGVDSAIWEGSASEWNPVGHQSNPEPLAFFIGNLVGFPLAKTSGANGIFPTFYTSVALALSTSDFAGMKTTLEGVSRGDFYVPVLFNAGAVGETLLYKFTWPHSIARNS